MEQNHKNNDCYFFYYSTCTKGDSCAFRHEPSALGCEVMCSYWQQGNCLNEKCNFRHMELKKNRKSIPCYWESQRVGCKKPHCPFMHTQPRPVINETTPTKTNELPVKPVNQEWSNRPDDGKFDGSGTESDQGRGSSEAGSFIGSPAVDPLIVNFDEESDSEGLSTSSPTKKLQQSTMRIPYCKTYEEIRLEEIQAESAAYYSYEPGDYINIIGCTSGTVGGIEKRITKIRSTRKINLYSREKKNDEKSSMIDDSSNLGFKVLTLDEIKKRKLMSEKNLDDKIVVKSVKRTIDEGSDLKKNDSKKLLGNKRMRDTEDDLLNEQIVKKLKIQCTSAIVRPVRLRRSPKRLTRNSTITNDDISDNETRQFSDAQNSRSEIEVRLCDSSTDYTSCVNEISNSLDNRDNDNFKKFDNHDLKIGTFIDGHTHDDEFIDTASDDILKDIDALLTEKSV